MGRQIYTLIKDPDGKIVWDSAEAEGTYFCGRYAETDIIAHYAYTHGAVEEPEHGDLIDFTDKRVRGQIIEDLSEEQNAMNTKYDQLVSVVSDARSASRNCRNLQDFLDFREYIQELDDSINETNWTRGQDMIDLMRRTLDKAAELAHSGFTSFGQPELKGYRIFWVVSE